MGGISSIYYEKLNFPRASLERDLMFLMLSNIIIETSKMKVKKAVVRVSGNEVDEK
jgi:inorganic pyrophosphatase/exopolyphosphatase